MTLLPLLATVRNLLVLVCALLIAKCFRTPVQLFWRLVSDTTAITAHNSTASAANRPRQCCYLFCCNAITFQPQSPCGTACTRSSSYSTQAVALVPGLSVSCGVLLPLVLSCLARCIFRKVDRLQRILLAGFAIAYRSHACRLFHSAGCCSAYCTGRNAYQQLHRTCKFSLAGCFDRNRCRRSGVL